MRYATVSEAAQQLGVSTRQVQYLVAEGALQQVARGLIDATSVERLEAIRGGSRSRAWSESTAWAAIALLSGADAPWLGATQRSRLRARLRDITADQLVSLTRDRAVGKRYRAHSSVERYLTGAVVRPVDRASRLGLSESDDTDGYVSTRDATDLVETYGLIRDEDGRVTLRSTNFSLELIRELANNADVVASLDAAESLEPRERSAGLATLARALDHFRG